MFTRRLENKWVSGRDKEKGFQTKNAVAGRERSSGANPAAPEPLRASLASAHDGSRYGEPAGSFLAGTDQANLISAHQSSPCSAAKYCGTVG
jgi:hypothetical protein